MPPPTPLLLLNQNGAKIILREMSNGQILLPFPDLTALCPVKGGDSGKEEAAFLCIWPLLLILPPLVRSPVCVVWTPNAPVGGINRQQE